MKGGKTLTRLLTMQELTKKLNCSRQLIYYWRDEGMPYLRLNRTVRYDYEEVMEWLLEKGEQVEQKANNKK